ncbi:MAG TPA: twin-arginine translocase subunit TatC [Gemmatimonadales bacterium]
MARASGDMPFLDHLEELRSRILRSLLAVIVCFALGLWLVNRFRLIDVLKGPIAPFLQGGQLTVLSPTEPLMIVLKLGLIVGLVLASPILLWQLWAFLSPALYEREKKTLVPALFAGLLLFLGGGAAAFEFIVPQALRVLMGVQSGSFNTMITFDAYFSFVMQVVLALGISCELPLLMIILAALGIVSTPMLNRIRPYAIVGSFLAGAVLSPGADVLSMFMLTIPLLLLYELGVAGVWVVQRRKLKAAAAAGTPLLLLLCLGWPAEARAQTPVPPPPPRPGQLLLPGQQRPAADTTRAPGGRRLDSASARRLGLPSAPRQAFLPPDSILSQLLELQGYAVTRYRADTATVQAVENIVDLRGNAMTDRSGSVLEAGSIRYREGACAVDAQGEPHLFQGGQVLIGAAARFDTCKDRGVVEDALTNFNEGAGNWFIRGNLAVDSSQSRLYGGSAELTSCDLPLPHYHFAARQIKWVSKSVLVARPAVLYVRDVPIAWIPFMFQDTKQGRRSGILIPQFGFNDIVRPTKGYNRQVTNIGFYWAPNDYFDATVQFDWFTNRYIQYGISTQYQIRNRFMSGGVQYSAQKESGGLTSHRIAWQHRQNFNVSTSLNLAVQYATNPSIVSRNAFDTRVSTGQIGSQANFTKRFAWGNISLGGSGQQSINDGSIQLTAPSFTISPKPLDLGSNVTWSPGLSITNQNNFKSPLGVLLVPNTQGGVDSVPLTGRTRVTSYSLDTPIRLWTFNWQNSVRVVDGDSTGRYASTFRIPNLDTPAENDSVTVTRFRQGGFTTALDWETGFSLPILFRSTWKLVPSVGIANSGPGPFAIRNITTGGQMVTQGKRFRFGLSIAPTFYGFFPGFAGMAQIRHSISPSLSYNYSPAGKVPEAFARAVAAPGQALRLTTLATQGLSLGLSQNFEAKGKPSPGDTTGTSARKFRLLSINTSPLGFDLEQAKEPGRTGWTTQQLSNTFASDLVPGFTLNVSHDLWEGPVGYTTTKFKPFLQSVATSFAITGNTFRSLGALFGLARRPPPGSRPPGGQPQPYAGMPLPGDFRRNSLLQPAQSLGRGGRPFQSNITFNLSRSRGGTDSQGNPVAPVSQSSIGLSTTFSPTRFWGVSWTTQYNATLKQFESQGIQLTRDLHEWRAAFNFQKSPNGNFAFYFSVFLSDLPALKFDYNQTTIQP